MDVVINVCFNLLIDNWFYIHNLIMKLKVQLFFKMLPLLLIMDFWKDNIWTDFLTLLHNPSYFIGLNHYATYFVK
jgi:hypothetical protein